MSRESQTGSSANFVPFCTTLKAATAPCVTGPCSIGYLYCECFGPQKGVRTQRVPLESSQLAMEPHTPAAAKLTSSLQMSGVRSSGVRWSSPPKYFVSSNQIRHSLLELTNNSRPL